MLERLDRSIAAVIAAAQWLALPLVVLLFLQWPLRELVHAYAREANDLAQLIFAVYVAISIAAATRAGLHLAADVVAHRYSAVARRRLFRIVVALGIVPWALFVLIASKSTIFFSVALLESFQETRNPGYFIIKIAVWIMAVMILLQSIVDMARPMRGGDR
jgi:TRAP-type C4-dicarboxylate transport system permease small subunit